MTDAPHRRRRLPHPRAARHLDQLAARASYQDKAPKLVKDSAGRRRVAHRGRRRPRPDRARSRRPGMPFDEFRWFGVTYEEARTGCYNGAARLEDMDIDGVCAEVLFPPQRTMSHFLGDDDDDFVLAGVEAYNNFLFEEFCAPDPSRLDRPRADPVARHRRRGRRRAQGQGARRARACSSRTGRRAATRLSRDDDPFWAAAVDEGLPVSIHINIISRQPARGGPQGRGQGRQRALRHDERGDPREGDRRHEPRVLDGGGQHHVDALHRRVRPLPRAAGLLDRDRGGLAPALHRVPRRPLLAQPRVGRPADQAAAVVLLVPQQRGDASSPTAPASRCATRSASTT